MWKGTWFHKTFEECKEIRKIKIVNCLITYSRAFFSTLKTWQKDKVQVPQRNEMLSLYCIALGFISKNKEFQNSKRLVFEKWRFIYLPHKNAIEVFAILDECRETSIGTFVLWVFTRFLLSSNGNWAFSESFYVHNSCHTVALKKRTLWPLFMDGVQLP